MSAFWKLSISLVYIAFSTSNDGECGTRQVYLQTHLKSMKCMFTVYLVFPVSCIISLKMFIKLRSILNVDMKKTIQSSVTILIQTMLKRVKKLSVFKRQNINTLFKICTLYMCIFKQTIDNKFLLCQLLQRRCYRPMFAYV